MGPLNLLFRQDFPNKGKQNRVKIEKTITFLATRPNWMKKITEGVRISGEEETFAGLSYPDLCHLGPNLVLRRDRGA